MYPSGKWLCIWEDRGRHEVERDLELVFENGQVRGSGKDLDGSFEYQGTVDATGGLHLLKRYVSGHVRGGVFVYRGRHDGEGVIAGEWHQQDYPPNRGAFELRRSEGREPRLGNAVAAEAGSESGGAGEPLLDQLTSQGGFLARGDGTASPPCDYRPGHQVHPIQAQKALADLSSAEQVLLVRIGVDDLVVRSADGSTETFACEHAPRLRSLHGYMPPADDGESAAAYFPAQTRDGWIAILSRRWHLLAVPVVPWGKELPDQMAIPIVVRVEGGAAVETVNAENGIRFVLFSIARSDHGT